MKRQSPPQKPVRKVYAQLTFVSASRPDEQHRTIIYDDGSAHCTCEGFQYTQDCRHTKALRHSYSAQEFGGTFVIALELQ